MKKITFTLALIIALALSGTALAQQMGMGPCDGNGPREGNYERRAEHLQIILNLTDAQTDQVKEVLKKHEVKRIAEMDKIRTVMEKNRDAEQAEIKAILDASQAEKYQKLEDQRPRFKKNRGSSN